MKRKFDFIKTQIPDEVLVLGLQFLPLQEIIRASTRMNLLSLVFLISVVNKRLHRIISESGYLWKYLCERDGFLPEGSSLPARCGCWYEMYKRIHVERFSCCARCGQRHTEVSTNEYHPGRWHDLSYPEFLESQNCVLHQSLNFTDSPHSNKT